MKIKELLKPALIGLSTGAFLAFITIKLGSEKQKSKSDKPQNGAQEAGQSIDQSGSSQSTTSNSGAVSSEDQSSQSVGSDPNTSVDTMERFRVQRGTQGTIKDGGSATATSYGSGFSKAMNCVFPKRNSNKDLINSFDTLQSVVLYPAKRSPNPEEGHRSALGYVDVSSLPNSQTSVLKRISYNSPIGVPTQEIYDGQTPNRRWLRVELSNPLTTPSGGAIKYGWIRSDRATFKRIC